MIVSPTKASFNAGIWSEKLDARSDLARYNSACSELHNFIPHPYGGVSNRAGTEFIFSTGNKKVRLISFQFNAEQSYILAFTEYKGYVLKDSGVILNDAGEIYEFSHPYTEEHLQQIQYIQSADVLYLTHAKYRPAKITRYGHNDWIYEELFFENNVPIPTYDGIITVGGSGTPYWYAYTLVDKDGHESELREISMQARVGDTINFQVSPTSYENGEKYNIYREQGGVYGWVDSCAAQTWIDPNEGGTNPDMSATPPQDRNPCPEVGDYPKCACIHQGRLIFAGSDNKPRTIFGSRTGSFTDFSIRSPLQDDDSYEFEISGGQVDRIEWIRSSNKGLLVGAGGGEYLIEGKPISPNSIEVVPQTNYGSAPLSSVEAGEDILYVQKGKNIIRSAQYSALSETFEGENIAMLTEELFENYDITAIAWQRDPAYILWCVREDGELLGLTYVKKEKVIAWHQHSTSGKFIDIAVIRDGSQKELLYFVVERNGQYHIELMKDRNIKDDINKSWFLDSAIEHSGDPVTKLSRLDHLIGMPVSVFAQGSVIENIVVEEEEVDGKSVGYITLPYPVVDAIVGLPYESRLATMEISPPHEGRYSYATINSVKNVTIYMQDSCHIFVSGTGGDIQTNWSSLNISPNHQIDGAYSLNSGIFRMELENNTKIMEREVKRNRVYVKNTLPLPVTICAMSFGLDISQTG